MKLINDDISIKFGRPYIMRKQFFLNNSRGWEKNRTMGSLFLRVNVKVKGQICLKVKVIEEHITLI